MPLDRYQRKRDFTKTPEPAGDHDGGRPVAKGSGRYVVQRHRATRLHYDFRLEIDGLLASWAIPKGPTLDPGIRRMAVHVEDHPIEYFDFEGVIPRGQYGAGDVIVWDWGTFEPEAETPDPARAVDDGELKFELRGEKLRGRYTLVRTSRRPGSAPTTAFEDDSEQWLLIKKRDAAASAGWDAEDLPQSVKTGRTNDEVKAQREAIWVSDMPAAAAEIDLERAVTAPLKGFVPPMLATLASDPFDHPDWLFEIKWDGYRLQAIVEGGKVRTFTRRGQDGNTYFPGLLSPPTWIAAETAIVDGEVVALDEHGAPDFPALQEAISELRSGSRGSGAGRRSAGGSGGRLVYQVFDLLYLDGRSLLKVPLEDRKRLLRSVLKESGRVRFASHVEGDGKAFHAAAEKLGLEGILAKLRRSTYEPGRRTPAWLKIKIRPEQELVVGGWTPGEGNAKDLGALAVGVYEGDALRFAGKVGSGFTGKWRTELRRRLAQLETDRAPFEPAPERKGELRLVTWVRPELVIRAEIGGWTRDGIVRQTAFKGIDEGHDPRTVTREQAVSSEEAAAKAEELMPEAPKKSTSSPKKPVAEKLAKPSRPSTPDRPTTAFEGATDAELEALAAMANEGLWSVAGHELKLTNLDKTLLPPLADTDDAPITKRELIAYFGRIAPAMLPHLADRPLNLHRFPNGIEGPGFWQKDIPATAPDWLPRWKETGVDERK